jgi:hypothetical protein
VVFLRLSGMTDSWMRMRRPVHGEVHVHYSQIYVVSGPDGLAPGLQEAFGGQSSGLCGAATPGALFLTTGLHTGYIGFTVEVREQAPPLGAEWEDVVEVSFRPESADSALMEWAGQAAWELSLDEVDYRVRYCAAGIDQARKHDTRGDGPQLDRYLLQFWPAPPGPDAVLKQTSATAAYWHDYARKLPPPPTPEERAEIERLGRILQEQADERARVAREMREWGGQLPSQALREVGGSVRGVLRFDAALVHALDAAGPETQRAVALLAANRACEAAGLTDIDWVAAALTALADGRVLPPPFDDRAQLWQALKSDPRTPHRTVRQAIPPERTAPEPPPPPGVQSLKPQRVSRAERPGLGKSLGSLRVEPSSPQPRLHAKPLIQQPQPAQLPQAGGTGRYSKLTFGPPDPSERVSQSHMALPTVARAAQADPLRAALDAVHAAITAYGENYPALLAEVWSACTG